MENNGKVVNIYFEESEINLRILSKDRDKADIIINGDGSITIASPEYENDVLESINTTDNKIYDSFDNNIECCVSNILKELGMPVHIKGYRFTRQALLLMLLEKKRDKPLTKVIYPEVGEIMDTSASKVERAIRHGIECIFKENITELTQKLFKYSIQGLKDKPTNGEFLVTLHDYCKNRHNELIK